MTRHVVVTGGGSGIGRAIAARFAAAGDSVVILGRRANVLADTAAVLSGCVRTVVCDASDPESVSGAITQMPDKVDVLVNNAGGRARGVYEGLAGLRDQWLADFECNVLPAVLMTAALEDRLTVPGGRIITISSLAALRGNGSYGAAKAALHAWNHSLAAQWGPRGVTANVVVPGFIASTEFFGDLPEGELARRAKQTLVGRVGQPEDIASCVSFLASPEAGYITGELLHSNGGAMLGR